jgi:hypothetical protein
MATRTRPGRHVSYWLAITSGGVLVGCLVLIALYAAATPGRHLRYLGAGLLTGVAAFAAGCLFGFLFGIPRLVSSGAWRLGQGAGGTPPADAGAAEPAEAVRKAPAGAGADTEASADAQAGDAPKATDDLRFAPSTNLAEISDWLTKLLLGAGLVSLTRLGAPLGALVDAVAAGLTDVPAGSSPDGPARLIAAAILVAFSVLGFLDFYVLTTLWYGRRLYTETRQ